MAGFVDASETVVLQWFYGVGSPTRPTAWHCALFTTTPTADAGTGGVEATGGSYARESFTPTVSTNTMNPSATVTLTTATASWGTINGFGIYSDGTSGSLYNYDDVTTPKAVGDGDTASFGASDLSVTLD